MSHLRIVELHLLKFHLTSWLLKIIEYVFKSSKSAPVQNQQKTIKIHWNKEGNSSKLTRNA